jgi:hypothetical protein
MIITTESGSVYELRDGYCFKNGVFEFRYWYAYCFDDYEGMKLSDLPSALGEDDADRRLPIQVGKHMHIGGKDGWWVSTKIISTRESEDKI